MTDKISEFQEYHPSLESYWRSIILFGRNVATYKFALAKALIDLQNQGKTHVTLNELAVPYSKYICEHVKTAPRQATSRSSRFVNACTDYNEGKIDYDQLINTTVSLGFNNVIDAFHNVNNAPVPVKFFEKNYTQNSKEIVLTDELYKLSDLNDLNQETDARWNLVETAWQLGLSPSLLDVKYDNGSDILFVDENQHRKDVTSARDALNGYQKGHCFYCFDDITVIQGLPNSCDVDHFFPHALQPFMQDINLDGVWNLVLACKECNRGEHGKFASVPDVKYIERLQKRNEFLITSHHPLRETIMRQTGRTSEARHNFLNRVYHRALDVAYSKWSVEPRGEKMF